MQIENLGDFMSRFTDGLDRQQPDWFIRFATQQELADTAQACTDGKSGTVRAKELLRRLVAKRLVTPLQAALIAGLIEPTLKVQS